jgi:hypothetical protein
MSSENSTDIELDDEYVLGVIDYCTRPSLEPYQMPGGYGLDTILHISLRQSEILVGVVSQFLDSKKIRYRYDRRDSKGIPSKIIINSNEDIQKLYNIGSGTFIQIAERMEYLNAVIRGYEGKTISGNEELFCQLYKPWADMHPHWNNKKYTIDFFTDEFGIESIEDTFDATDPKYPNSISTEYVSGAFDGSGMIALLISEEPVNNTGHGMSITARITISHPDIRVKPHLIQYFQSHGFDPGISNREDRLEIRFESVDNVERFVKKVGENTTYLYSLCELFYSQLIPAFKDQYHTTKEGFMDIIRAYEEVAPERPRAKYTAEYFEEKWDIEQ